MTAKNKKTDRHTPSTEETLQATRLVAYAEHNARFSKEPLVKAANKRSDSQRSAMDYLLISTDAWQQGKHETALRLAYTGLALAPADKRILSCLEVRLGTVFADLAGEERTFELATECFTAAKSMDKKFSLPLIFEGDMYFDQGDYEEAEECYKKAVTLDPTNPSSFNSMGYLFLEQDRLEEAELEFRKAEKLEPDLPIVHLHLATVLQRQNKLDEAVDEMKIAIRMYPDNASYCRQLGDLYTEMGKKKDASKYYEKAVTLLEKN